MKNGIEVLHTRVFAYAQNGGNPCPVLPFADKLSDGEMQTIARKFGLDTVFLLHPTVKTADIRLRYFVPDHEMGVSGHATIAAITVARLESIWKSDRVRVETNTGLFDAQSSERNHEIAVTLEQNQPVWGSAVDVARVARVLKLDPKRIVVAQSPIQSVSVSRPKLLIPIDDSTTLNNLAPDYRALWELCDQLKVTGFYPFTGKTDKRDAHAEARQFPLRAGFPEDAATGVAAGALGAYLATYDRKYQTGSYVFRVAQGFAMRAPSLIEALVECAEGKISRTAIRGTAEIVGRERIEASNSG
jgi:PhzF family phenazine biosynthesis protein